MRGPTTSHIALDKVMVLLHVEKSDAQTFSLKSGNCVLNKTETMYAIILLKSVEDLQKGHIVGSESSHQIY